MTQVESPKRKMQKKNDYQRHKLFRKIKRRRKAQAEADQEIAEKQLKKKLKLPKFGDGKSREVYTKDIHFNNDETAGGVDRYGNKFDFVELPEVVVNERKIPTFKDIEKQIGRKITQDEIDKVVAADPEIPIQISTSKEKGLVQPSITNEVFNTIFGTVGDAANYVANKAGLPNAAPNEQLIETSDGDTLFDLPGYAQTYRGMKYIPEITKRIYFSENPNAQYLRYIGGKLKYGFDAQFPDLYRRYSILPDMSGRYTVVSPIQSRFAYNSGDVSPLISNFTTDYPVLPNNGGDWSTRPILRFPGKTLLGKNVVSTRPSDTFTFGENIKVPTKDIQIFNQNTNQRLREAFELMQKNANARKSGRFLLEKPRDYGSEFEQALLEESTKGNRPRLKDYQFMDYVLRPKYTSQVHDVNVLNLKDIPEDLINAFSNAQSREQLLDGHYENVIYNPASPVEEQFRNALGIVERNKIPINKRKFNSGKNIRQKA